MGSEIPYHFLNAYPDTSISGLELPECVNSDNLSKLDFQRAITSCYSCLAG